MREVILSNGMSAQVDDEDFERVNRYNWHPWTQPITGAIYAYGRVGKRGTVSMHSFIMDAPPGMITHHIEEKETLNNQRSNLLVVTTGEHKRLHATGYRNNTSGFTGVSQRSNGKFRAYLKVKKIYYHLGIFSSAEEAAMTRDLRAIDLGYPIQGLNFQQFKNVVAW
jgi:hypothetical protein